MLLDRRQIEARLVEIKDRLNDIWFGGKGPAGGDIHECDKEEFYSLLREETKLLKQLKESE